MTFADIRPGDAVFLDANTLVYHFQPHATFGLACTDLLERIERQEIVGFTSTHIVTEVAHRLMLVEANAQFGWPFPGITRRLHRHPDQLRPLIRFRQSLQEIPGYRVQILTIPVSLIDQAAAVSQRDGLLSNDALIVALMEHHGLTQLASNDADFDRVLGLTRYAPA